MDINMPIVDGLSATRELLRANSEIGVIILSMHHEEVPVLQALRAGARGYLLKTRRVSEVAGAVRAVASGLSLVDPTVTSSVVSEFKRMSNKQTPEDGLGQLSETEIKILQHVSAGMSNRRSPTSCLWPKAPSRIDCRSCSRRSASSIAPRRPSTP